MEKQGAKIVGFNGLVWSPMSESDSQVVPSFPKASPSSSRKKYEDNKSDQKGEDEKCNETKSDDKKCRDVKSEQIASLDGGSGHGGGGQALSAKGGGGRVPIGKGENTTGKACNAPTETDENTRGETCKADPAGVYYLAAVEGKAGFDVNTTSGNGTHFGMTDSGNIDADCGVPERRLFPKDEISSGIFPVLPVAVEERISAACFSKLDDRWLAVFGKNHVMIYDTTMTNSVGSRLSSAKGVSNTHTSHTNNDATIEEILMRKAAKEEDPDSKMTSDNDENALTTTVGSRPASNSASTVGSRPASNTACANGRTLSHNNGVVNRRTASAGLHGRAASHITTVGTRTGTDETPREGMEGGGQQPIRKKLQLSRREVESKIESDRPIPSVWRVIARFKVVKGYGTDSEQESGADNSHYLKKPVADSARKNQKNFHGLSTAAEELRKSLVARKKTILNNRTKKLMLNTSFCYAMNFNADDTLLGVGIMHGAAQNCSVYFYDTKSWTCVHHIHRCNAIEFFPRGRCKIRNPLNVQYTSAGAQKVAMFASKKSPAFKEGCSDDQSNDATDTTHWICIQDLVERRNEVICTDTWTTLATWESLTLDVSRLQRKCAPICISPDAKFVVTTRTVYSLETEERIISLEAEDESGAQRRFLFMDFTAHMFGRIMDGRNLSTWYADANATSTWVTASPEKKMLDRRVSNVSSAARALGAVGDAVGTVGSVVGKAVTDTAEILVDTTATVASGIGSTIGDAMTGSFGSSVNSRSSAKNGLFAAIMQVQAEIKIYVYETSLWLPTVNPSLRQPCVRLYEPNVVYSKVRFINGDSWLTSYGEDASNSSLSGVRIWDTTTWAIIHLIRDGVPGQFPYCCGWRNPWVMCLPNRRRLEQERQPRGLKFGDSVEKLWGGFTAKVYDYSREMLSVSKMETGSGDPKGSSGDHNGSNANLAITSEPTDSSFPTLNGHRSMNSASSPAVFGQGLSERKNVNKNDVNQWGGDPVGGGEMTLQDPRQKLWIGGNVFVKGSSNRYLILAHEYTFTIYDLLSDDPNKFESENFTLVRLPIDPDIDLDEMDSNNSFYILDAVLSKDRLLIAAVMGLEGGRSARVGNEIKIFELNAKFLPNGICKSEGGNQAGSGPAIGPHMISAAEQKRVKRSAGVHMLGCVNSFRACEKFFTEKQSIKGRFSSDGRLFFANCVRTDEAHIYGIPSVGKDRSSVPPASSSYGAFIPPRFSGVGSSGEVSFDVSSPTISDVSNRGGAWHQQLQQQRASLPARLLKPKRQEDDVSDEEHVEEEPLEDELETWECLIIFDRTYTSGQAMFSPDSRWFTYNGELYDTRDWTCVSDEWSEATIRCDKDTLTGRFITNDVFLADSSEADQKGLILVFRYGVDPSAEIEYEDDGDVDSREPKKTWYFDKKVGEKRQQHLFAHFDEIVTMQGRWLSVCDPGKMTAIYDLDQSMELAWAVPSKKSRGIFAAVCRSPSPAVPSVTTNPTTNGQELQKSAEYGKENNKSQQNTIPTAEFYRFFFSDGNGNLYQDFNIPFLNAAGTSYDAFQCLQNLEDSAANKHERKKNIGIKKSALIHRWTREFPGCLDLVDPTWGKSLLYFAIENRDKQIATCILDSIQSSKMKLSLHARNNVKLVKMGVSSYVDVTGIPNSVLENCDTRSIGGRSRMSDRVSERICDRMSENSSIEGRDSLYAGQSSFQMDDDDHDADLASGSFAQLTNDQRSTRISSILNKAGHAITGTSLHLIRGLLGVDEQNTIVEVDAESEFSLAIRLHERDLTEQFVARILEGCLSQWSLYLVWKSLPALLRWVPGDAEKLLEAFVVDPPFIVPELKASLNPASRLISRGTSYFGYQKNVWGQHLEEQSNSNDVFLEPVVAKVVAIPEMVAGSGDGQGLLTLLMENNVPSSFYSSTPARILIDYKWQNFARDELQMYFVSYSIFLVSFTTFAFQLRIHEATIPFVLNDLDHVLVCVLTICFYLTCTGYRFVDVEKLWQSRLAQGVSSTANYLSRSVKKYGSSCGICDHEDEDLEVTNPDLVRHARMNTAAIRSDGNVFSEKMSNPEMKRAIQFAMPLILFTTEIALLIAFDRPDLLNMMTLTIMIGYTLRSMVDELKEFSQKSFVYYISSIWNLFDITLCVLNILVFFAYISSDVQDTSNIIVPGHEHGKRTWRQNYLVAGVTVGALMAWLKIFYFCLPFRNVGSFIRMVIEIFVDIRYFLIVVGIALGGFGTAFLVLYKDEWLKQTQKTQMSLSSRKEYLNDNPQASLPRYPNVPETLLGVYVLMLGDWNLDDFVRTEHPILATGLFVTFTFVMMIILFNLLIAIMSDTYERVRENEENTFLRTRTETICDMQKLSFRHICYEPWVHALLPQEKDQAGVGGKNWKGKLGEIKDLIKYLKKDFSRELDSHKNEMEALIIAHGSSKKPAASKRAD